jgi:Fe2+ transport system protein FeoA
MGVFDLKAGECGVVTKINLEGSSLARLNSLGIKEGARVQVVGFSLFNTSVLFTCGYVRLAARKAVAQKILVKKCK